MTYLENTPTKDITSSAALLPRLEDAPKDGTATEDEALEGAVDALSLTLAPYVPAGMSEDILCPERGVPLSFPGAPTYTSRLRAMMPIFIAQLFSMFTLEAVQRGAQSRIWDIRRALYVLYTSEKDNFTAGLTRALTQNPIWQAQVREDLGGEAALTAWEHKQDTYRRRPPDINSATSGSAPSRPAPTAHKTRKKKAEVLTDRTGLFRLAPHKRASRRSSAQGSHAARARSLHMRNLSITFRAPKPASVTPDQLRPGMAAAGKTPQDSPTTPQIWEKIWQQMQEEHRAWMSLLETADLMTLSRDFRKDFAPP